MHVSLRLVSAAAVLATLGIGLRAQQTIVISGDSGGSGPLPGMPGMPDAGGPSAKPLETGTGLIYGQAIDGVSTRPVANALVTLMVSGSIPVRVLTDGDGRYTFRDVPKGGFSITASKPGYSDGAYGRLRPNGPSQSLQLTDGQRVTDVTLPLWKLGTIAGSVFDDSGDPVVGAAVRILERTVVAGTHQLQMSASGTTDDRGMYRIGSLVPGQYVVVLPMTPPTPIKGMMLLPGLDMPLPAPPPGGGGAMAFRATSSVSGGGGGGRFTTVLSDPGGLGPAGFSDDGHELWYQTTYYPAALTAARADVVTIKPGEEHGAVDFTIRAVRTVTVSGTLMDSSGPAASTQVTLLPADAGNLVSPIETANAMTDDSGHFQFSRVPAGQYSLRAVKSRRAFMFDVDMQTFQMGGATMVVRSSSQSSGGAVPPLPTDPTMWTEAPVTVGTSDIADLAVSLRPGIRVGGRVEFNGSATRPTPDQYPTIGVTLIPADGKPTEFPVRGRVEPSGTFTTMGVPSGKYVLRVDAPTGWVLRGAMLDNRDISDAPVELRDADVESVTITFTDQRTSVTGEVTTSSGSPDSKATVILFPEDSALWVDSGPSPRRLKTTRPRGDGTYSLSVPAGDYYVIAVSDTGSFEWNDPQFLAAIAPAAVRITVNEGDAHSQALRTTAPPATSGGR
jgi:Carboxypeptidase regulatory-like domain